MNAHGASIGMLLLSAAAMLPIAAWADGFEGTLKLRTISVSTDHLAGVLDGKSPTDPQSVFAVPVDKLLALKDTATSGVKVMEPTIYVKGSKVRVDRIGSNREGYVIIDLDSGTSWIVTPKDKKYVEWTKADTAAMADKMAAMQKQMQERVAKMPPEQRQQMEAMMKGMPGMPGAPAEAPKVEVHALGKTQTINGTQTTGYEARRGSETVEAWVTQDHKDLLPMFQAMHDDQEKMLPGHKAGEKGVRATLAEYGLPVRTQTLDGRQYQVEDVMEVQKKSVAADLFAMPSGFEKTSPYPKMGPQGHGSAAVQ